MTEKKWALLSRSHRLIRNFLFLGPLFLAGCASAPPSSPPIPAWAADYFPRLRAVIEPKWASALRPELKKLIASGMKHRELLSPENGVAVSFELERDGTVGPVTVLRPAKIAELNQIAISSVASVPVAPAPPEECFRNGHCVIRWEFLVQESE